MEKCQFILIPGPGLPRNDIFRELLYFLTLVGAAVGHDRVASLSP